MSDANNANGRYDHISAITFVSALAVGIASGALLTWTLLMGDEGYWMPLISGGINTLIFGFAGFSIGLLILIPFAAWWVSRFATRAKGSLEEAIRQSGSAIREFHEGNVTEAVTRIERIFLEIIWWYGPVAARRWIVQVSFALLISFGGLVGTALLYRQIALLNDQNKKLQEQTELLKAQNDKLDLQTVTAEAQRRSVLTSELFAILKDITLAMKSPDGGIARGLDDILKARIIAFSRASTPYWTVDLPLGPGNKIPVLASRARSPERGQLLIGLVAAGVNLGEIADAVFDSADLRRTRLKGAKLAGVKMNQADLSFAELHDADLSEAQLALADFTFAVLDKTTFSLDKTTFSSNTILDFAVVGPIGGFATPASVFPSTWSTPPENYKPVVRDNQVVLVPKDGSPRILPFLMP